MSTPERRSGRSRNDGREGSDGATSAGRTEQRSRAELANQVEELRAENRRIREAHARTRQRENRRTALGLLAIGLVGIAAGIAFPSARTILFALGATGVFGAVLSFYLSPDRFVPATVGLSAYDSVADIGSGIRKELGLTDVSVYVPVESQSSETRAPVRLFVPQSTEYTSPSDEALQSTFVVSADERERGVAFTPTAGRLLMEFERAATDEVSSQPGPLAAQLCDALVEQFELVRSAEAEIDSEANRVTIRVSGGLYPDVAEFDSPVASFLGSGFARGLDESVTVETDRVEGGEAEMLVTCRW